jgi:hypothetical protein
MVKNLCQEGFHMNEHEQSPSSKYIRYCVPIAEVRN